MFLLPLLNRDAFPNNTNRKPILRDCLTRRTGQPTFLLSIQLIYLKVQLVFRNHATIGNWLRNYVLYCPNRRHLRYILLLLIRLLLLLLGRLASSGTVFLDVVGITTFDTLCRCHPCLLHGIGDKLFTRFFGFIGSIRLVEFRTGALRFRLRILLLHTLGVILLGSLRGFIGILLLLCPTCPFYLVLELGPCTGLSSPFVIQGRYCIGDSMETHLNTGEDFIQYVFVSTCSDHVGSDLGLNGVHKVLPECLS